MTNRSLFHCCPLFRKLSGSSGRFRAGASSNAYHGFKRDINSIVLDWNRENIIISNRYSMMKVVWRAFVFASAVIRW